MRGFFVGVVLALVTACASTDGQGLSDKEDVRRLLSRLTYVNSVEVRETTFRYEIDAGGHIAPNGLGKFLALEPTCEAVWLVRYTFDGEVFRIPSSNRTKASGRCESNPDLPTEVRATLLDSPNQKGRVAEGIGVLLDYSTDGTTAFVAFEPTQLFLCKIVTSSSECDSNDGDMFDKKEDFVVTLEIDLDGMFIKRLSVAPINDASFFTPLFYRRYEYSHSFSFEKDRATGAVFPTEFVYDYGGRQYLLLDWGASSVTTITRLN